MDVQKLHEILLHTFQPDPQLRNAAEEYIQNLHNVPGSLIMLLQIISAHDLPREVRQAAALSIKNMLRKYWSPISTDKSVSPFSTEVKQATKEMLLSTLLVEHDNSIRDILSESLKTVSVSDFPQQWPELIPTAMNAIAQAGSNIVILHNALVIIRAIVKRYEFKSRQQQDPRNEVINTCFPTLFEMYKAILEQSESEEAGFIIKILLKIFWSIVQTDLPFEALSIETLFNWIELIRQTLIKINNNLSGFFNPPSTHYDITDRHKFIWWKVQKWCCQLLCRFFNRFSNPHNAAEGAGKQFAEIFSTQISPSLLEVVMTILSKEPCNVSCSNRVYNSCLTLLNSAIDISANFKLIKPHIPFLISNVIFPRLCITNEERELFELEPQQYLYNMNDPILEHFDPKTAAINLLHDLAKYRTQYFLDSFLHFIVQILNTYKNASPNERNPIHKEGALVALGSLHLILKKKKHLRPQIEPMLVQHVFPEFVSEYAFLRSRAFWSIQYFFKIKYNDQANTVSQLIQCCIQGLHDSALPVRFEAANSLKFIITLKEATAIVEPLIPNILNGYFGLMSDFGSDIVISALEIIIAKFESNISPHALTLAKKLAESFFQYVSTTSSALELQNPTSDTANDVDEAEDEENSLAANQCIIALSTVVSAVKAIPELLRQLEQFIIPIVTLILGHDGVFIEYMDGCLTLLSYLTYHSVQISPELWQTFPMLINAFHSFASDFINDMVSPLDNFIGRAVDEFLRGSCVVVFPKSATQPETYQQEMRFIDCVISVVEKIVTAGEKFLEINKFTFSAPELLGSCHILMSLLHNCSGKINNDVAKIVSFALRPLFITWHTVSQLHATLEASGNHDESKSKIPLKELQKMDRKLEEQQTLLGTLVQVISSAFFYDASITLHSIRQFSNDIVTEINSSPNPAQNVFNHTIVNIVGGCDPEAVANKYFEIWLTCLADEHDSYVDSNLSLKLMILGITSVLNLSLTQMKIPSQDSTIIVPAVFNSNIPTVLHHLLKHVQTLNEEEKKLEELKNQQAKNAEKGEGNPNSDDDDDSDGEEEEIDESHGVDENEDILDKDDEDILDPLGPLMQLGSLKEKKNHDDADDEIDEDAVDEEEVGGDDEEGDGDDHGDFADFFAGLDDEEDDDEEEYDSPIDNVDHLLFFKDIVHFHLNDNPRLTGLLQSILPPPTQTQLQEILEAAAQKEILKQQQQQQQNL